MADAQPVNFNDCKGSINNIIKGKILFIHKTYGQGSGPVRNTICKVGISKIELLYFRLYQFDETFSSIYEKNIKLYETSPE